MTEEVLKKVTRAEEESLVIIERVSERLESGLCGLCFRNGRTRDRITTANWEQSR
jgi:hypothetical protein